MTMLSMPEAQLFRLLASFFGEERVIPKMSVMAVCGGSLPEIGSADTVEQSPSLNRWARENKCLFTVVDHEDEPRLVVEFFAGFQSSVDVVEEAHQRVLPELLKTVGIHYVTISPEEFRDVLDPDSELDICALLNGKMVA